MKEPIRFLIAISFFCLLPCALEAHAPNQSYLFLRVFADSIGGRFEINTDDLNKAMNLKLVRGLSVEDIEPHLQHIQDFYRQHTAFSSIYGDHSVRFEEVNIMATPIGDYVQLSFTLEGISKIPEALNIHYNILFDKDPTHMGLQVIEHYWKAGVLNEEANLTLVFGPNHTDDSLDLSGSSVFRGIMAMIHSGMHHIFIGLDHILFLLALLLPSVVSRSSGNRGLKLVPADQLQAVAFPAFLKPYVEVWIPNERFRTSLIYLIKIVTFFTIAHTITLSLAALKVIMLPSALVESVIALSIALAALNNVYPMLKKGREWLIAFLFGLFHGFGFASVLAEVGLEGDYITWSLLGFNLGVEVGQVIIVSIIFPILFLLRKTTVYKPVLIYGSVFLILVALNWFFDRSLGTDLPLDNIVEKIYARVLKVIF